jgi:hypothetical protein
MDDERFAAGVAVTTDFARFVAGRDFAVFFRLILGFDLPITHYPLLITHYSSPS